MKIKQIIFGQPALMIPLLICLIGAATASISIVTLFNAAIDGEKAQLTQMVHSQAHLMEAVAEFDLAHDTEVHPDGAFVNTMEQIVAAHKSLDGFGETGEFIIGKLIDGEVTLLQKPRYEGDVNFQLPPFVPVPMQRALLGGSGEIIAADYKGNEVLAAYIPVPILDIGLVAKVDTAEIYRPFILAGFIAAALTAAMLVLGIYAARRLAAPFAEREEVMKTLKTSEQRFRDITESSSDWFWETDAEHRFSYVSERGPETIGVDKKQIIGSQRWNFKPDELPDAKWAKHLEDLENRLPFRDFEYPIDTAFGKTVIVSVNGIPMFDDDGGFLGYRGSARNVTARRQAEIAMKKSEERFTKSQNFANIGTWDWNIQTGELYWSDRIAPLFGYETGALETTYDNFVAAIHPDDRQTVTDAVMACVEKGVEYNIEHRVVWPDGTVRCLLEKGDVVRDENGAPLNMLGVVQDITENKTMQAQLIQSSKMATLGEMATGVAHELNQPLNIIRMALNNIQRKSRKNAADPEYLSDKLDKIDNQVERASKIIDHMRIFGRKPGDTPVALDPKHMVDSTLGLVGEQLRMAEIEITTEAPAKIPAILGHQVQVEQVLLNLIGNARDILKTKQDGDKRISITIGESGGEVFIAIEDSGGGIAEADLGRVFEPFFTTKEIGQGTGLGLSISYGIINDMGGTITASNIDAGARFLITLPQSSEETAAA